MTNRILLGCVRAAGGHAVLLAVASITGAVAALLIPAAIGRTVDAVLAGSPTTWIVVTTALVTIAACADVLADLATATGTARATAHLRRALLARIFTLPHPIGRPAGDLVARLGGQAADAGSAVGATIGGLVSVLPPAGSLVALALIDPWLAVALVTGILLLTALLRGFVVSASASASGYQRVQGRIAALLAEAMAGARTIAAAGTAEAEIRRVLRPLPELGDHGRGTWSALAVAAGRTALLAPLTQLAVVAVAGVLLTAGRLTPGELIAALQYAALGAGLGAILATLNRLIRARSGATRAAEIIAERPRAHGLRRLPDHLSPGSPLAGDHGRSRAPVAAGVPRLPAVVSGGAGTLRLEGVTVRAVDGRTLLDRLTLTVPGGATVAVVGRSGSGKSTLAAVAGRLRDPDRGTVRLDGVPLPELDRESLAAAVGYGFERPALAGRTIGDAIAMGRDPAFVPEAARVAAIDDYVRRLPGGYDTPLTDAPMSGGEAQRLGLARALHAGRLLVLDDASSSLDSVTEARIGTALTRHAHGVTRLVITHRRATAAAADLVAWLDAGRLRGCAPHHALWADPGYRAVFSPCTTSAEAPPPADTGSPRPVGIGSPRPVGIGSPRPVGIGSPPPAGAGSPPDRAGGGGSAAQRDGVA
ncbi:ATP-binding cassette subfamily B protein [Catenuloplanes nepalensis]|uniref:ATP-binding cassette subfamily B protein n=1 Tax=Catenuloplanes nepalensis TaxID=587533 RepID=A0ABT9MLV2_9ACTN|nr:ABC transporter ATP-binding protein [Catenuloplanes nepalensis]MDP9792405.1 ATP-binding cassette subfamily B protein [Catenuloplanes nepalensis]